MHTRLWPLAVLVGVCGCSAGSPPTGDAGQARYLSDVWRRGRVEGPVSRNELGVQSIVRMVLRVDTSGPRP